MKILSRPSPNRTIASHRNITGIVLHWWGDPSTNPTLDGIVSWLCNPQSQVSAHYAVSGDTAVALVPERYVAWHAGTRSANWSTIGLELDPDGDDATYATAAALIASIRQRHGDLPLLPHRHFVTTQCPGTYDLDRLDRLARGAAPAPVDYNARASTALGASVIKRWQAIHATPVDGVMSSPTSTLVYAIQRHQNENYAAGLHVDGVFGPLTCKAVQRDLNRQGQNVAVDGVPGPETRAALARVLGVAS